MLVDLWKHFPAKFADSIVQDRVLEEVRHSLRRAEHKPSLQTFAIAANLVDLFEFLLLGKTDRQSQLTAVKIKNLLTHLLNDLDASKNSAKEFLCQQVFRMVRRGFVNPNDFLKVFLRVFQSHGNLLGATDMAVVRHFVQHVDELTDKHVLCLLDFNCHVLMADLCWAGLAEQHILALVGAFQTHEATVAQFQKFLRLAFNWLYKNRQAADKAAQSELAQARERLILDLLTKLVTRPQTSEKITLVIKNMAALISYQLRRFASSKRARGREPFAPGLKELILAKLPSSSEADRVSPEELLKRYERVFEHHLGERATKDMEMELDKLLVSADLANKRAEPLADFDRQEFGELSSIMSKHKATLTDKERRRLRLEQLRRAEQKMKLINEGVFADKKAVEGIQDLLHKRKLAEHQRLQLLAADSLQQQEKAEKQAKLMQEFWLVKGPRSPDPPLLLLEQLVRPLGTRASPRLRNPRPRRSHAPRALLRRPRRRAPGRAPLVRQEQPARPRPLPPLRLQPLEARRSPRRAAGLLGRAPQAVPSPGHRPEGQQRCGGLTSR